ncbi:Murein L,D-transpeptidase YcbB/YkuD [Pleomorphomonas diazotrophica]|uniref:L,D-transpeptidase family protein n=1 Tax=Pleomorphomonas diazotrophica TaxID=1166257 RepID=UPI0008E008B6|nr:L,D-transpeptidase family protein [Pleomorphomonas diazotrophica]SFN04565.1 Murein L,D-transpeptidase YcbB/YkuD [Pleomorphomonas diazotrophica]
MDVVNVMISSLSRFLLSTAVIGLVAVPAFAETGFDPLGAKTTNTATPGAVESKALPPANTSAPTPGTTTPAAPAVTPPATATTAAPAATPSAVEPAAPATETATPAVTPATEPAPAVATAPPAMPLDQAIVAEIAKVVASATGDARRRADAVAKVYAARGNQPLWVEGDHYSAKAKAVIARLADAVEDGLNPVDYALPEAELSADTTELVANADLRVSMAVATFAEQASGGRVAPRSISKDITRTPERIAADTALATVADAIDVAAALEGFNPSTDGFRRLKAMLAEVRATKDSAEPAPEPVALVKSLKPGMSDDGVPALRKRLGLAAPAEGIEPALYDDALVAAVEAFQKENGLTADGVVGARTLAVLNGAHRDVEGEIIANMEMWRWMPRDLSQDYVFVNIPEFKVRVVRNGQQVHEARVVVGKTANQTPVFSGEMQYLVVNPYWHVPESIKIKEMLPAIQADPAGYFARHGYEVTWDGQLIDPTRVIWDENAVKAVGIRQVPGEANALGNIKFMFPNKHAVYLHDTPLRSLFNRDVRAFSHGCVRVDDPMAFADAVLQGDPEWTVPKLRAMFGGAERRVDISTHLKVHLAYFTAFVDEAGKLQLRDDIYGHVQAIKKALGMSQV